MQGIRVGAAVAVLAVALVAGCAGSPRPSATVTPPVAAGTSVPGQALVHVHEFPGSGHRLAPPTWRPVLSWEQAIRTGTVRGYFPSGPPPEVRLADYSSRFHDLVRRALVWVAVDPDHASFESGPDLKPAARDPGRCPLYVVVDATSGRGYGAWQTCDPPYRG
jgi:hypothetical protein